MKGVPLQLTHSIHSHPVTFSLHHHTDEFQLVSLSLTHSFSSRCLPLFFYFRKKVNNFLKFSSFTPLTFIFYILLYFLLFFHFTIKDDSLHSLNHQSLLLSPSSIISSHSLHLHFLPENSTHFSTMKPFTLFITIALVAFVVLSIVPNSEAQSRGRKMRIMKKLGAILLLQRKKYLFAVPFPLPVPIP